jgi:hypothetical protein
VSVCKSVTSGSPISALARPSLPTGAGEIESQWHCGLCGGPSLHHTPGNGRKVEQPKPTPKYGKKVLRLSSRLQKPSELRKHPGSAIWTALGPPQRWKLI